MLQDSTVEPVHESLIGFSDAALNTLYSCPIHGAASSVGDMTSLATMSPYIYVTTDKRKTPRCQKEHDVMCRFHTNKKGPCRHVAQPPRSSHCHRRQCSLLTDTDRVFCTVNSCRSPCLRNKHGRDAVVWNISSDQRCTAPMTLTNINENLDEQRRQINQPSILIDSPRWPSEL